MPELKVTWLGSDVLVRGTVDVDQAVQAVRESVTGGRPAGSLDALFIPPMERAGLWRWNPCSPSNCDERHPRGHLTPADSPGHGVFPGVHFTWKHAL